MVDLYCGVAGMVEFALPVASPTAGPLTKSPQRHNRQADSGEAVIPRRSPSVRSRSGPRTARSTATRARFGWSGRENSRRHGRAPAPCQTTGSGTLCRMLYCNLGGAGISPHQRDSRVLQLGQEWAIERLASLVGALRLHCVATASLTLLPRQAYLGRSRVPRGRLMVALLRAHRSRAGAS